jgi:hypothetical protein
MVQSVPREANRYAAGKAVSCYEIRSVITVFMNVRIFSRQEKYSALQRKTTEWGVFRNASADKDI